VLDLRSTVQGLGFTVYGFMGFEVLGSGYSVVDRRQEDAHASTLRVWRSIVAASSGVMGSSGAEKGRARIRWSDNDRGMLTRGW
jgi:hypothetical protein